MRFGVKAVIIAVTLVLSCAAGLAIARAETTAIYLPLMISNRSKIGIAPGGYRYGDFAITRPSWTYRWNNEVYSETQQLGIEQVDMLWDERYFYMPIRSNTILGFNEPDLYGQADMTPLEGAIAWNWIETIYPTKTLVSPAPSQLHPDWLWQMVSEYEALYGEKPRFDGLAVHYYRWSDDMPLVSDYLAQRRADEIAHGYTAPLWLTEVGACGASEVKTFRNMATFVEMTPWVERAAWYKLRADQWDIATCSTMIDERGGLTPLGEMYRGEVSAWR